MITGLITSLPLPVFKGATIEVEFEEVVRTGVAVIIGVRGCVGESGSNDSSRSVYPPEFPSNSMNLTMYTPVSGNCTLLMNGIML